MDLRRAIRPLSLWLILSGVPAGAAGQAPPRPDLGQATLEDLMKIRITSAARKEQRADEVPAAIFVITQEDIRRSGMRTLPELFRLVPGVQVARLTSSKWAVSIRGFNDRFSNKLLVLVDGRSIFNRVFSGVFWDAEDLVLDDIERIEVIRGPGAAVWGANAVNGVINIVTKSAADSQGALVRVSAGTFDRGQATARYGGKIGGAAYRVYSQWTARGDTSLSGSPADDNWRVFTNGMRLEWARGASEVVLDGSVRSGDGHTVWKLPGSAVPNLAPRTDVAWSFRTGHVMGRWTRRAEDGSALQVQSSIGIARRADVIALGELTFDADAQYHTKLGARHDVVAGGGVRVVDITAEASFALSFDPTRLDTVVTNGFVQDEIKLAERVHLTLGSKLEHDTFSGWGLQPSARVMWAPGKRHHVWLAASRALRTPSATELGLRLNALALPGDGLPIVAGVVGNPQYQAEVFHDVEAGYRLALGSTASVDVTTFRGRYGRLPTREPLPPVFESVPAPPHLFVPTRFENRLQADTRGLEVAAHVTPTPGWRVDASYSTFRLTARLDAGSADRDASLYDGNAPAHQWQVHSSHLLGSRTEVDATLFHMGALGRLAVRAYTRADARVAVALTRRLSVAVAGGNLLESSHGEYDSILTVASRIPRSVNVQLVWKY
jgi:iron complex outermembrane receptor protein